MVMLASAEVITLVLISWKDRIGYVLDAAFVVFFLYDAYVNVQFTKTAGMAIAAGYLLIWFAFFKKKKPLWFLPGIFLALLGSMIRFNVFWIGLAVFAAFMCLEVLLEWKKRKKEKFWGRNHLFLFASLIVTCLAVLGARFFDSAYYNSDADWKYYREYNNARATVTDSALPAYNDKKEEYKAIGVSENDRYLYSHWTFDDPELFTMEKMEKLASLKEPVRAGDVVRIIWKEAITTHLSYSFVIPFLAVGAYLIYLKRRNVLYLILSVLEILVFTIVFIFMRRYLQYRVDFVIYMFSFLSLAIVALCKSPDYDEGKKPSFIILLSVIVLFGNAASFSQDLANKKANLSKETSQKTIAAYDAIFQDQSHLYLLETFCDRSSYIYDMFGAYPEGYYANVYHLGGWETQTPVTKAKLIRFGIVNPFRDAVNNENVYFISSKFYMDKILAYIQEHYAPEAGYTQVGQVGEYYLYTVTT
ncbi:MAG: hypothetical protein IKG93_03290 [Clostridiales bacterium]|nr:hypothetical protein [Clostridiales bacterium]